MVDHMAFVGRVAGIHSKIAQDVWPDGLRLVCKRCEHEEHASVEQAGRYLRSVWPRHCGESMLVEEGCNRRREQAA